MATSALRVEESSLLPQLSGGLSDETPALEVRASYKDVLIGTRLLSSAASRKRFGGSGGLDRRNRYLIGESAEADAPAPSEVIGGRDLPLVARWGAGFLVNVTPQMTGDVAVGGKVYRLADYLAGRGTNFTLPPDGQARIQCGAMSFQLAHTVCEKPLPKRWLAWRWAEQKFTLGSFLALGVLLLLSFAIPPDGAAVSDDLIGMRRAVILSPVIPTVPKPAPEVLANKPSQDPGNSDRAQAGASGQLGDKNPRRTSGALSLKGDGRDVHVGQTKQDAKADILNRGILGILNGARSSPFNSIFGRGSAAGDASETVLGTLAAGEVAGAYGAGGLGITGSGWSGGGGGLDTIGLGNQYHTVGGTYGTGRGVGDLRPRRPHGPIVTPGMVTTTHGSLDKEIIRRVVHLHMNEVKYCYDQELVRKAGLEGRLSVQFVISPVGQVLTSVVQSSTLGNVYVEKCVTDAVKRWPFPKPQQGGIAIVSYPFNFVAGNE
jgi:TonB family protein